MVPRISTCVLGVVMAVAAGAFCPGAARAQHSLPPLQLSSLEWAIADSEVVVRGVVVAVAADAHWNIVTLDVREMLKGAKTPRLQFAAYRFAKGDAGLARAAVQARAAVAAQARRSEGGGRRPRTRKAARPPQARPARTVRARPTRAPALPVIPLGPSQAEDGLQPPAYLTTDLRVPKTADEMVQAIRTAIARTQGQQRVRSYVVTLPHEVAQRTGFSRPNNTVLVPVDDRLETLARRLVQSPGDFLTKHNAENRYALRLEGVKALRFFPSEKNLAIVRAWLDNPAAVAPFKDRQPQSADLVPPGPSKQPSAAKIALPVKLADVPEIHFQRPLTKAMKTEDAQLHTAVTIDSVNFLNQRKTDGFIETLMRKRPDLAGLSFAMGDACRMKPEASRQFVAALDVFHKADSSAPSTFGASRTIGDVSQGLTERYQDLAAAQDRSICQRGGAHASARSRRRRETPRPGEVSQHPEARRRDPCSGEARRVLRGG